MDESISISASREEVSKLVEVNATTAVGTLFIDPLFTNKVYSNRYLIQPKPGNTGAVYISLDNANDSVTKLSVTGIANVAAEDKHFDLSKLFVVAANSGDGVLIFYNSTGKVL